MYNVVYVTAAHHSTVAWNWNWLFSVVIVNRSLLGHLAYSVYASRFSRDMCVHMLLSSWPCRDFYNWSVQDDTTVFLKMLLWTAVALGRHCFDLAHYQISYVITKNRMSLLKQNLLTAPVPAVWDGKILAAVLQKTIHWSRRFHLSGTQPIIGLNNSCNNSKLYGKSRRGQADITLTSANWNPIGNYSSFSEHLKQSLGARWTNAEMASPSSRWLGKQDSM